jgi:multidrug efflux pump subunit AcrB
VKRPVEWMARNHVAANLLMLFLMLTGLLGIIGMRKETFPEFSLDQVQIQVPYLGASPEEVEEGVSKRIEERLSGLEGIRKISSTSSEGMGVVSVELDLGTEMSQMLDDIKNEIDRIDTFPEETEKPVIKEMVRRNQVIDVVAYGEVGEKALKVVAERMRDDLRDAPMITQVQLAGVRIDEISIEVSEKMLRRHGLSLAHITDAVRRASLDLPGGSVKSENGEVLVRTKGLRYTGREYEQVVLLTRPDGTSLKLGQIASIRDGFEDSDLISRFNGQPAAVVQVYRTGDQSALEISEYVKQYVQERRTQLPAGVHLDYARDDARLLLSRLDLLLRNARLGLVLVFILLTLFLDLRLAFWVMMGIPISLLGSFLLMQPFDVSINMLSLFAFIVALGIVVDDAIIVGENVFAHRERGKSSVRAAIDGTLEVAKPVTFSVLTSIAAFMPLFYVEGMMGKFMAVIPVIVISMLAVSLIEALVILPAHLSSRQGWATKGMGQLFRAPLAWHGAVQQWMDRRLKRFVDTGYRRTLNLAIANPLTTIALAASLMLVTIGWVGGGHIKFVFMPKIDSDWLTISLVMPQGTTAEQTELVVKRIEAGALAARDEYDGRGSGDRPSVFRSVFTVIGDRPTGRRGSMSAGGPTGGQGHVAEITIELLPSEVRELSSSEIAAAVRSRVGEIPGPESLTFTASLFSAGDPVDMQLSSDDFPQLLLAVERLKSELASYPGVSDIQDSFQAGKLEMTLALRPQARTLGLTLADLARQVRQGFYGDQALRVQRGSDDVRVMIRYPEDERRSIGDIRNMRVRTPDGAEVPFAYVADVTVGHGYASIERSSEQRIVSVTADIDEKIVNADEVNRDLAARILPALIEDYPGLRYSYEGEQRERADSFASLGRGFIIAMFAIYALLAVPFRSYTQPLVVMSAIPFGIIGAVWGHVLMGLDLALLSMFGIVALSGVVVNDSLVLLTFYNELRRQGRPVDEALVEAGCQRFRPILLTSLTTFFALLPMILEKSVQAQFLIPMAVSLGFGILFATVIILVGVPVVMRVLYHLLSFFGHEETEYRPEDEAVAEVVG